LGPIKSEDSIYLYRSSSEYQLPTRVSKFGIAFTWKR
jgi:hypothetical protein